METSALSSTCRLTLPTLIQANQSELSTSALVDSGAEQNFISMDLINQLSKPTIEIPLVSIAGVTGSTLVQIRLQTVDLHLIISSDHHETNRFFCV